MNILDILGAAIGLVYVFSEYRASRWFWPSSLLMAAFYAVINFRIGWYANTGICVYNFVMSVYGLLVWRGLLNTGHSTQNAEHQTPKTKEERPITSCPARYWPWLIAATAALAVGAGAAGAGCPPGADAPAVSAVCVSGDCSGMGGANRYCQPRRMMMDRATARKVRLRSMRYYLEFFDFFR